MKNAIQNTNINLNITNQYKNYIMPTLCLFSAAMLDGISIETMKNNTNHYVNQENIFKIQQSMINDTDEILYKNMLSFAKNIIENSEELGYEETKILNDNILELLA
ncbi:hypothetical protein [Campylobacter pinnipediorum]|uniref:hypothetical protein n=1 Tax=Campylobacter pinnipediorum TaxID=1965231 RepID=UPI0009955CB7|nr:hypothetical protein [Campylobacter pinnipediorum]AQW82319.1 hypothetical protein CPIN17261_0275 [Campylobacter pinnipediorum subsp. pinnipediorum]